MLERTRVEKYSYKVFFKMGHSSPLSLYFCLFNAVEAKQMLNINFANDQFQTADLWYWK